MSFIVFIDADKFKTAIQFFVKITGKVINLEYGFLESRNRLSRISNTDFSNLETTFLKNGYLEFNLEKTLEAPLDPRGRGCMASVLVGWGWGDDYRECYDPIFEIKFEITVLRLQFSRLPYSRLNPPIKIKNAIRKGFQVKVNIFKNSFCVQIISTAT